LENKIKNIVEGAFNSLLNKTNLLSEKTKELVLKRLIICKACDIVYFDFKTHSLRCGDCKCFINWKTHSIDEKCPLNKW